MGRLKGLSEVFKGARLWGGSEAAGGQQGGLVLGMVHQSLGWSWLLAMHVAYTVEFGWDQ